MPEHQHVLRTRGVTITATLDLDTFQMVCTWNPRMPETRKKLRRIMRDYVPWRDRIFEAACQAKQICALMMMPDSNGKLVTTVYGKEFSQKECSHAN